MGELESARGDIIERLKNAESITVISHYNPDADAYGSALGLSASLRLAGKSVTTVNESGIIERYAVLPGLRSIRKELPSTTDILVACDCGSFHRVGDSLIARAKEAKTVINVDHHVSNDRFGTLNLVDTGASSTCEIVFDLIKLAGFPLDAEAATCLLAGIIGDTGSFRYSCTTAKTLRTAADLTELGASPTRIFDALYGSSPLGAVKLQAECMSKLELSFDGRFAETVVTEDMVARHGATFEDTDGLAERIRDIEGVKIAASLRQQGGIWRVSLRSADPAYNVSDIAASFGGGGHVQAAAFRSSKSFASVQEKLRKKVGETLA